MNYTLNIGLGNNPLDSVDICVKLRELGVTVTDIDIQTTKESNWCEEQVVVVDIETELTPSDLYLLIERMCVITEQETIAFRANNKTTPYMGYIAYHPSYTGEFYEFNSQYFKTI